MIINYDLSRSNLSDIRRNNTEFFNKRLTTILTNIYPTILFQIEKNKLLIKDVPLIYIDSIKNTLDEIFKNPSNLFEKNNSLFTNEDSLINLMFKSFSLENKNINLFLDNILNIKIEYKEDLFFYSSSFLKEPNNLNSRIKLLYQDNHRYFYKINYNSNIHTKSSLELFNGLLNSNNPIQVINNPSSLFQFEFKLDNDIHLLSKVINVYSKKNIHECDTYKLSPTDIAKYEKNFKYITFLKDRTPIIEKRNVIKAIQNNITSGEITSGEITSGEITSGEITSGEITIDEIKKKLIIKFNKIELMLSNFNIVEKNQSVSSQEEPVTQSNSITDIDKIEIHDYYKLDLKGDDDTKIDVSKKKYLEDVTKILKNINALKTKLDKEKKQLNSNSKSKGSRSESNKKVTQELKTKNIDNNERIRRAEYLEIKADNLKKDIKLKAKIKKVELKKKKLEDDLKSAQNIDQRKLQELAEEKAKISLLKMREPPRIKTQTGGSSKKLEKILYNSSNSISELTCPIFAYNGFSSSNTNTHYMALCIKYPKTLFIFNDGLTSVTGKGGTASIRDMPNAIGIPMGAYKGDWVKSYSEPMSISNHNSINGNTKIKKYKVYDKNNIIEYNESNMTFDKVLDLAIRYIKKKFNDNYYNSIIYSCKSKSDNNIGLGLFSTETSQSIVTLASQKLKDITDKKTIKNTDYEELIQELDKLNLELCDNKLAPIIYSDNYSLTSDLNKNIFILRDSMILNFGTKKNNEYLIIPHSADEQIEKGTLVFEVAKNIIKEPISENGIIFSELHLRFDQTIQIKTKAEYLKSENFDYRLNVNNICFVNVQSINEKLTDESKNMSTYDFKQSYENELIKLYRDIITEVKDDNRNQDELNICFPIIMGGNIHNKFNIEKDEHEGFNNEYITKISDFIDSTLNSLYDCFFDSIDTLSKPKINIYLSAYKDFDYERIIYYLKNKVLEDDKTLIYTEIPKEIPDPSPYYTSVPVYVPSKQMPANSYPNISINDLNLTGELNNSKWSNQGVVPFYYNDDDSGSFNVNGRIYDNMYQSGIFGNFYGHRFHRINNFSVDIIVNNSKKKFTNSESAFHATKFTTSISTNQMMPTNQSGNCIYCKTRPKYTMSFFCGTTHRDVELNCAYCRTVPKIFESLYCNNTECKTNGEKIRTQGNNASKGGGNKKGNLSTSKYIQKGGNKCAYCHREFTQDNNRITYCGRTCAKNARNARTGSSRPVKSTVNLDSFTGISGEQAFQLKRRLQQDRNYGFQKSLNE